MGDNSCRALGSLEGSRIRDHMRADLVRDPHGRAGQPVLPPLPLTPRRIDHITEKPLRGDVAGSHIGFDFKNKLLHGSTNGD